MLVACGDEEPSASPEIIPTATSIATPTVKVLPTNSVKTKEISPLGIPMSPLNVPSSPLSKP